MSGNHDNSSAERLKRVLDTDAVGVLFFDYSGTLIDANDAFLKMTGYTREQVTSKSLHWRDLTPPEYISQSEDEMKRLEQTGRIGPYEKEYLMADGSQRWMHFTGRDLGDGTLSEYVFDISDQKRDEAVLRESGDRLVESEARLRASEARLEKELSDTQLLQSISTRFLSQDNIAELYLEIVKAARLVMRSEAAMLQSYDSRDALHLLASEGLHPETIARWQVVAHGDSTVCDRARQSRERVIARDVRSADFFPDSMGREPYDLSGIISVQATPLRSRDGQLVGMLSTLWQTEQEPSERDLQLFDVVARQAADLLERARAEEALRESDVKLRSLNEQLEVRVRDRTRELEAEVHERRAGEVRIKNLLRQLVNAEEQQRRRVARELHDTFGQQLAALHVNIEVLRSRVDGDPTMRENIERMRETFDRLNSSVDFLAWELRPPSLDMLGLDAALGSFVKEWSQQFGVEAVYEGIAVSGLRLDAEAEINLYRIFQEALQNVHKHAGADRVNVVFERCDGQVVLIIEDNGIGYDSDPHDNGRGMGLINIQERASLIGGIVEIESQSGAGTTIFVRVPVSENGTND